MERPLPRGARGRASYDVARACLIAIRLGAGAVALAKPDTMAALAVGDSAGSTATGYFARLFGIRDVAYGIGLVSAAGNDRKRWLLLGIATDVSDLLVSVGLLAAQRRKRRDSIPVLAGPAIATALGVIAILKTPSVER